jgi:hypothetical protein
MLSLLLSGYPLGLDVLDLLVVTGFADVDPVLGADEAESLVFSARVSGDPDALAVVSGDPVARGADSGDPEFRAE